jgi:adenylylsulfate kinase
MTSPVPVLLLNGTVGAGKTTVASEIHWILVDNEIPNAVIDLDWIRVCWPETSRWNADMMFENLSSMWRTYRRHGAQRLVLAHVIEDHTERERYLLAVPEAELTIVRLTGPEALRKERLRSRMPPGPDLDWHLHRTVELESILERADLDDHTIVNDERTVRHVATEILDRIGWLD